jgi:L-asparaginase
MAENALPRLALLLAAGTLHSRGADRMDFMRYGKSGKPRMTGEELIETLPELSRLARMHVDEDNPQDVATPDDLRRLSLHVNALLERPDIDGVIMVQGTNSLEETAYFLDLTVRSAKPVVVTGAQRPYTALSADGPVNLLDAVRVAIAPATRGLGVLVVTNGEINASREVTKTSTYRLHTFRSRDIGVLGYADADKVVYYRAPTRRHTAESEFDVRGMSTLPRVDVLYVHACAQPGLAEAAVQLGAKGIVVAGSGAGATGNLAQELTRIVVEGRAIVVQSSRVGEGRVVPNNNWSEPGMIASDNLPPHKSSLLLTLALTRSSDPVEIQRIFDEY